MQLTPTSEAELAEIVRGADNPLFIRGGGTRGILGDGAVLNTTRLNGITLYEPGALTMVAGAGTPLAQIEAALETEGQMLAFEPFTFGAEGEPTIGGVFATNASGARRVQVGAARDFLLGVRFVDGMGNVIKNGGRVMKNVTGYDLVKLMAGAYGTLGVLSEVSFKVLPKPAAAITLAVNVANDGTGIRALGAAMNTPFDVSGAAMVSHSGSAGGKCLIRVEGFQGSVRHRADSLKPVLAEFGTVSECQDDPWPRLRRLEVFDAKVDATWRLALRPGDAAAFVAELAKTMTFSRYYDWAGGRLLIGARGSNVTKGSAETPEAGLIAFHHLLQKMAAKTGGHAALLKSSLPLDVARFQPESAGIAALSRGIRAKFDPKGILNPGVMG